MTETKYCKSCDTTKLTMEFPRHKANKDGLYFCCGLCKAAYQKEYYKRNKTKLDSQKAQWVQDNLEHVQRKRKEWHAAHREEQLIVFAEYAKNNAPARRARNSARKATKRRAAAKWASKQQIALVYNKATRLTIWLDEKFHVDHIVPLTSEFVCGLHCEANLQILPALDNISKKNYWWPDMWEKEISDDNV